MTRLWSPLLVLVSAVLGGDVFGAELRVAVTDAGGAPDARLTGALAQALADAGLPATAPSDPRGTCRRGCMRVAVRGTGPRRFEIEVSAGSGVARSPIEFDPSASSFDLAHALAIQVEMLTDQARARGRRAPRPALVAATEPTLVNAPEAASATAPVGPTAERSASQGGGSGAPQAAAAMPLTTSPAAPPDQRLALSVSAIVLGGTSGDLFMHGSTVNVRVALTRRVDVRMGVSLLRPQNGSDENVPFHREVLPLQVSATSTLPGLRGLRAGLGVEGLYVTGDEAGRETPSMWSMGVLGRLELRYAIRSFALLSGVQAAYHPASWRTGTPLGPAFALPPWTLGASLGLEFRVF